MLIDPLVDTGIKPYLVHVGSLLAKNDVATLNSALNPKSIATVVFSSSLWNRLTELLNPPTLPKAIVLTSNRSALTEARFEPQFALPWPDEPLGVRPVIDAIHLLNPPVQTSWQEFEQYAKRYMSVYIGVHFTAAKVGNIPKVFDMVWANGRIVGDAKYLAMVRGSRIPPAKFMEIAGHVWLLNAVKANRTFLVFGNDRRVPELWLEKYARLVKGVEFYFLGSAGELSRLL
jgi:hypothetical protein